MPRGVKSADQPSKAHMVREALAALGDHAKPVAIQTKIQEMFGTEISTAIIASYKSNMKKSAGGSGRKVASGGSVNVNDLETIKSLVSRLGVSQLHALINVLAK